MFKLKSVINYFSMVELVIWLLSSLSIIISFVIFDRGSPLNLIASLIGILALILCAKGNPIGQVLIIVFSILYGIISFSVAYYGEMITYVGMSAPMAVLALISWIRNPYNGRRSEVKVNRVRRKELIFLCFLTALVTFVFYFILRELGTSSLIPSTLSVATSFSAVYLTFRRSPYYALAYAANDIVLLILWGIASFSDAGYISVTVCFAAFLMNDIYGFYSWQRMAKRQSLPVKAH